MADTATMTCGTCGKTIRYPVEKAGRTAKCPGCGDPIRLRESVPETPTLSVIEEDTPEGKVRVQNAHRVKSLGAGQLFVGRELRTLVAQLMPMEEVRNVAAGTYESCQGIIVLTDKRVFFYEKGLLFRERTEEFQLSSISSVQSESGMLMASLKIHASSNIAEIKNIVPKTRAKEFAEMIRISLNARRNPEPAVVHVNVQAQPAPAMASAGGDLTHRLGQLKKMLDAGLISQAEFDLKRSEILSCL